MRNSRFALLIATSLVGVSLTGCALAGDNLLGGRQKCWSDSEPHSAALFDGRLELSTSSGGGILHTSDGTDFETEFPFMVVKSEGGSTVLVDHGTTVAASGDTVTLFGGVGARGVFVVCAIEERHPA